MSRKYIGCSSPFDGVSGISSQVVVRCCAGVQGVVGWVLVARDWIAGDDGATGLVADGKVDGQPGAGKVGEYGVLNSCYPPVGIHCRATQRWLKGDVTALDCLEPPWLLCLCLECVQVKHLCLH